MKSKKIDETWIRKGKKEKILKVEKKVGKWRSDRLRGDCPGPTRGMAYLQIVILSFTFSNNSSITGFSPWQDGHLVRQRASVAAAAAGDASLSSDAVERAAERYDDEGPRLTSAPRAPWLVTRPSPSLRRPNSRYPHRYVPGCPPACRTDRLQTESAYSAQEKCNWHYLPYKTTTTMTILRHFIQNYPGEPVPKETFTHISRSLNIRFLHLVMIHSILRVQSVCMTVFLHNLSPSPLGLEPSTSKSKQ